MATQPRVDLGDYSGLEVVPPSLDHNASDGLQVVATIDHTQKHLADNDNKTSVWIDNDPRSYPIARDEPTSTPDAALPRDQEDGIAPPPQKTILGLSRKKFWIVTGIVTTLIIAAAIGGGIGGYFASRDDNDNAPPNPANTTNTTIPRLQTLNIAALGWVDPENVNHYRVYHQPANRDETNIYESAWDSISRTWTVSNITNTRDIKLRTPLAASAGIPKSNATQFPITANVYYAMPGGRLIERANPHPTEIGAWENGGFSNRYTTSFSSGVFSYWYQDLATGYNALANFFQEGGQNQLSVTRYVESEGEVKDWAVSKQSVSIEDGSPIAVARAGRMEDVRVYVGGSEGTLKQYPYDVDGNSMGNPVDTTYKLPAGTPLCVTTEDNRNWFTPSTLPECARGTEGTFLTHLVLFATEDRQSLRLLSWNCSSGFIEQQGRIEPLLKPGRTYLSLDTTAATNLTFTDQRVYVLYDAGNGPAIEEWQVPPSGGASTAGQNGGWKSLGGVETAF
ncbi:hypothetical protein OQA88_633 [Cercophora sp. LCS_1]